MSPALLPVIAALVSAFFIIVISPVVMERSHMERRAKEILAQHPDAETTLLYVPFQSVSPVSRRRAMEAKIQEMEAGGWRYLKASEAKVAKTSKTWGGGLNLHFIKV